MPMEQFIAKYGKQTKDEGRKTNAIAILRDVYNGVAPSGGSLARAPAKAAIPVHDSGRIAIAQIYDTIAEQTLRWAS